MWPPSLYAEKRAVLYSAYWKKDLIFSPLQLPPSGYPENDGILMGCFAKIKSTFFMGPIPPKTFAFFTRDPGTVTQGKGRRDLHPLGGYVILALGSVS